LLAQFRISSNIIHAMNAAKMSLEMTFLLESCRAQLAWVRALSCVHSGVAI